MSSNCEPSTRIIAETHHVIEYIVLARPLSYEVINVNITSPNRTLIDP